MVEPTYQYYKSKQKYGNNMLDVDYKSVELPIGVRHGFYLKNGSKLFVNASYVIDIPLNSSIRIEQSTFEFEIDSRDNMAFGLGYQIKEKYSIEFRYGLSRDLMNNYVYWSSDYASFSFVVGITLL